MKVIGRLYRFCNQHRELLDSLLYARAQLGPPLYAYVRRRKTNVRSQGALSRRLEEHQVLSC